MGNMICEHDEPVYTYMIVRLKWKIGRLTLGGGLSGLFAGCSGINTTQSVSPIGFLLPGAGHGTNNSFAAFPPLTSLAETPH